MYEVGLYLICWFDDLYGCFVCFECGFGLFENVVCFRIVG